MNNSTYPTIDALNAASVSAYGDGYYWKFIRDRSGHRYRALRRALLALPKPEVRA